MSLPENCDEHKIAAVDKSDIQGNNQRPSRNKPNTSHSFEGNMISHENILPKSKSYHIPEAIASSSKGRSELHLGVDTMKLSSSSSDDIMEEDWVQAKDSLERLNCKDKIAEIVGSKSVSCASSVDKSLISESPHSESLLGTSKTTTSSVSKVLSWDPWDKLGRKNKKENKRRKADKVAAESNSSPTSGKDKDTNRKDFKSGDELRQQTSADVAQAQYDAGSDNFEEYVYQPYQKNRSVEFTNKVMVVYINKEDKVVGEASEPLKKELEQQIRNKEMRRGHMPDVTFARRGAVSDWYKK